MKLNHDCIREVLMYIEENTAFNGHITHAPIVENLDYDKEITLYAIIKLIEAGYVKGKVSYAGNEFYIAIINSLSWEGHLLLDDIRDNKIWNKTKSSIKNLASVSLPIIQAVAASLIKAQLNID